MYVYMKYFNHICIDICIQLCGGYHVMGLMYIDMYYTRYTLCKLPCHCHRTCAPKRFHTRSIYIPHEMSHHKLQTTQVFAFLSISKLVFEFIYCEYQTYSFHIRETSHSGSDSSFAIGFLLRDLLGAFGKWTFTALAWLTNCVHCCLIFFVIGP